MTVSSEMNDLQLPYVEDFVISDYYFRKEGESDGLLTTPHNIEPHLFGLKDEYVLVGHSLWFAINEVLKEPKKYKEFLEAFVSEDCALVQEYERMKKYCESLSNRQRKPQNNIFDSMIRRSY